MQAMWRHRYRRTTFISAACVSFLIGIGLGSSQQSKASGFLGVLVIVWAIYRRKTLITLLIVCLIGLALGLIRGGAVHRKLQADDYLVGQKVSLITHASSDAVYGYSSQLAFDAAHAQLANGNQLTGDLQISGFGVNAVYEGDTVAVSGKLQLGRGRYSYRLNYAQLAVLRHHTSYIAVVKRKFTAGMQTALPEPLASFAMGLLIGQRSSLPTDVKQALLMVGLTHIIAVSGYNLTILLNASQRLFGKLSKRLSTATALILMSVFLLLTGFSASIVRAAVVSLLSIWATYYGRNFQPLNLILIAAAITAGAKPVYVWSDVSWYLSFLAFFGVLVLAPLIKRGWTQRWRQSLLAGIALESICAELMTLPFVLHTFGQMSLIGLPANVLVVTLIPLAMLLSLIAGLAGMFSWQFVGWLAWPAQLLLTYMLDVATRLSHLPHVFLQNLSCSLPAMVILYASLAVLTIVSWFKKVSKNVTITDSITLN